jgi:site-specific DNA recombinase
MVNKRIGVYCRVSSEEQSINGFGLENQREKLIQYCNFKDWTLLEWFEDTCSGGSMKRPGLKRMLKCVKKGKLDVVLAYRADRLSRKLSDLLRMIEEIFDLNGVIFISATEEFNSGSAIGKAFLSMLGTFSEFEINAIKERTLGGKKQKALRGGYVSGNYPYGYCCHNKKMIIDQSKIDIIIMIFEWRKAGKSFNLIARELNESGIHGAKCDKWHPASIHYILKNPIYKGVLKQTIQGEVFEIFLPELKII